MTGVTALIGEPFGPWQAPHTTAFAATSSAARADGPMATNAAAIIAAAPTRLDRITPFLPCRPACDPPPRPIVASLPGARVKGFGPVGKGVIAAAPCDAV